MRFGTFWCLNIADAIFRYIAGDWLFGSELFGARLVVLAGLLVTQEHHSQEIQGSKSTLRP